MKKLAVTMLCVISIFAFLPVVMTTSQAFASVDTVAQHDHNQQHGKEHAEADGHGAAHNLGKELPLWTVLPFAGILLSIALFPLVAPHFWHQHFPKISAMWALIFAIPFLFVYKGTAVYEILHIYIIDYIPFIILLWALFTISGGIFIRGTMKGNPAINTLLILIGTLLASWIGTTGAAMLMIRPILRSNSWRKHRVHTIVFFIFLVANIGGSLTPLGDPPLFLGFLHNVPFFWTLKYMMQFMGFAVAIIIVIYFLLDSYFYSKEDKSQAVSGEKEPLKIEGAHNLIFLMGVMAGVIFSGVYKLGSVDILGVHQTIQNLVKDGFLILMGILSLVFTKQAIRKDNEFSWFPIQEVAYLFAGIFMTIIPALAILKAGEQGAMAGLIRSVKEPAHYFWVTGILSGFLDNAPTYLTFFNTALGSFFSGMPEPQAVQNLIAHKNIYLEAIAVGAVFFGAMTYIGNAPNFMVKSIAEEAGIPMPTFFGYMFKYAIPILFPIFILITLIFF